jgi:hypothetical protein
MTMGIVKTKMVMMVKIQTTTATTTTVDCEADHTANTSLDDPFGSNEKKQIPNIIAWPKICKLITVPY